MECHHCPSVINDVHKLSEIQHQVSLSSNKFSSVRGFYQQAKVMNEYSIIWKSSFSDKRKMIHFLLHVVTQSFSTRRTFIRFHFIDEEREVLFQSNEQFQTDKIQTVEDSELWRFVVYIIRVLRSFGSRKPSRRQGESEAGLSSECVPAHMGRQAGSEHDPERKMLSCRFSFAADVYSSVFGINGSPNRQHYGSDLRSDETSIGCSGYS